ncbi:hypothetical protein [uncultured Brevundimonas sp.]|uniref:hypothetical protein n=1 Tax=uncultured Brevundimonas sp. TaxID=213418 RepID=UPI002616ADF4|nr:hypothetical protein [uncultured Brevundimonas sp.]
MAGTDSFPQSDFDPQDTAEVYDETHLDDEGQGGMLLDELDDVYDATRNHAGGLLSEWQRPEEPASFIEDDEDFSIPPSPLELEADALLGAEGQSSQEIELVYTGLMRNERGAQASAAHWEAKRLSDEDVQNLGYDSRSQGGQA